MLYSLGVNAFSYSSSHTLTSHMNVPPLPFLVISQLVAEPKEAQLFDSTLAGDFAKSYGTQ